MTISEGEQVSLESNHISNRDLFLKRSTIGCLLGVLRAGVIDSIFKNTFQNLKESPGREMAHTLEVIYVLSSVVGTTHSDAKPVAKVVNLMGCLIDTYAGLAFGEYIVNRNWPGAILALAVSSICSQYIHYSGSMDIECARFGQKAR